MMPMLSSGGLQLSMARRPFCSLLILVMLCCANGAFAGTTGVISGKIKTKPAVSTIPFPSVVRVMRAVPPFDVRAQFVAPDGAFRFSVPAGPYIVLAQAWRGDALGYSSSLQFVVVKSGKTAKARKLQARYSRRLGALPDLPTGPIISVGNILMSNPDGSPFSRSDGSPITFDTTMAVELGLVPHACTFHLVEDRQYGKFGEIMKELKLQSTKYFDLKTRISLKSALRSLAIWAPQYRLTGTIGFSSNEFVRVADLKIVDISTGKTVWCRRVTFSADTLLTSFPTNTAVAIANALCGQTDLPASISGSFSGRVSESVLGTTTTWSGSATYVPTDPDPLHGQPAFLGVRQLTTYRAQSAEVHEWDVSGGNQCTYAAHDSAVVDNLVGGAMLVEITPAECGERRYTFLSAFEISTPTTLTITCDGHSTSITRPWEVTLNSSIVYEEMPQFTGNTAQGAYSNGVVDWTWNMSVAQAP